MKILDQLERIKYLLAVESDKGKIQFGIKKELIISDELQEAKEIVKDLIKKN